MILALRTDKPQAELYLYNGTQLVDSYTWQAHRQLSETLLIKIEELLAKNKSDLNKLTGIIIYQGPGSFTGLRIGITVANTLADSLQIPITAALGESWIKKSLQSLELQKTPQIIMPEYGSEPHITEPRK